MVKVLKTIFIRMITVLAVDFVPKYVPLAISKWIKKIKI